MVAPIDATAKLVVGEGEESETFILAMNMRTFALAKAAGYNFFKMGAGQELDAFDLAAILKAFATPAHPDMTEDVAFAIACRHGEALGKTIQEMSTAFAAQVGNGATAAKSKRK